MNKDNFYYGYNRDKARLGNRRTMERSTILETLGKQSQIDNLLATIEACHRGSGNCAITISEQAKDFRRIIEKRAKENGVWIDNYSPLITGKLIGKGGESEVYLSKDGRKAIKITHLTYFANSEDLIYKVSVHNLLFPEVRYGIIGFGLNSENNVSVVLEQPYIIVNKRATQNQVDNYMESIGFEKKDWGVFENKLFRISDTLIKDDNDNVLLDREGNLCFIDVFIIPVKALF